MHNIGMEEVGSALLLTLGFVGVSALVVALVVWGLYKAFKNRDESR
ncbi:hypothetical protein [Thiomicrospira sp. WB1]|nr:hypothetical protein [Thiomicrospira sp. WB1]